MVTSNAIREMDDLLSTWAEKGDRRTEFLGCYRMMTENMLLAIASGEFHDSAWVRRLLELFAGYYFAALTEYDQERPTTPAIWSTTHQATGRVELLALQNIVLGVNAHINYDLALTLYEMLAPEWAGLSEEERRRRYDDHCRVNEVIGRTIDDVQDRIVEAESPMLDVVDKLLGPLDEWSTSRLIGKWREEVWQHSMQLLAAGDSGEREEVRRQIEELTLRRAQVISEPVGWRWLTKLPSL